MKPLIVASAATVVGVIGVIIICEAVSWFQLAWAMYRSHK